MEALKEYVQKRDFESTPEPRGAKSKIATSWKYVIQKHAASRLHYDFRLELDGTLKSWAVPKGPSLDPSDKRLAVHVEDHPLEYASFEGIIPKGQYGGGTVMVWDEGVWEPLEDPHIGYKKGKLKFRLQGKRLEGTWALVRMGRDPKNWLLIKEHEAKGAVWNSNRFEPPKNAVKALLPKTFHPELATLVKEIPSGPNWLHEVKFDGYRILSFMKTGKIHLLSRNGMDWTSKFSNVVEALSQISINSAILDGEIVILNEKGTSSFGALQQAFKKKGRSDFTYFVFDLPYYEGYDLSSVPLMERKAILRSLFSKGSASDVVRFSDHIEGQGSSVFQKACAMNLEGVVSKKKNALYIQRRTGDWTKVKCNRNQEFVIAGFSSPGGARQHLGSLILGVYDDGDFRYAGRVGTGFTSDLLDGLSKKLKPLIQEECPFLHRLPPKERKNVTWVKPKLVAYVEFTEWTSDGRLRHPSFKGLREDKTSTEVIRERPKKIQGHSEEQTTFGVKLTHPDRVLYPEQGITKLALAQYYKKVFDWMIPFLKGRPLSVVRCPQGREQECFFQKHPTDMPQKPYLAVDDLKGLISLVQMGVLEIHGWGCKENKIEQPDMISFDLDPAPEVSWPKVIECAFELRERFQKIGLESFVKTSGGKGLHVVIPIIPVWKWDIIKAFSRSVAEKMTADSPERYISTMSKGKRQGKIFIDYLRNGRGATNVVAYSTRSREGAPVSMPISWKELIPKITAQYYRVENIDQRLKQLRRTDPWKQFFFLRQKLTKKMLLSFQ